MCKSLQTPTRPSGMTLLEVIMAVAVIAVAILGTFNAWMNSQRMQLLQREESQVQAMIERYMNDIRSRPFQNVDNHMPGLPAVRPGGLYDYTQFNGIYMRPRADILPTYSYFDPVNNQTYIVENDTDNYGYSGGQYPNDPSADRLMPGKIKLFLGWTGTGSPSDSSLRGVKVSKTQFSGAIKYGSTYWAPQAGIPEMRVVFINNEDPVEARMGEDPENPSDGIDLNGDGQIEETRPMSQLSPGAPGTTIEFGDVDAKPMFPRLLASPLPPGGRAPVNAYVNVTNLTVYPVMLQVRWWSIAGMPREIGVLTFLTNRAGSTNPVE